MGGEPTSFVTIDAQVLADWLARRAADRWWTVDGEDRLLGMLPLPCSGQELASAFRKLGGRLLVFVPKEARLAPGRQVTVDDLEQFAEEEDGARVFLLAWADKPEAEQRWVVAEDTLAKAAVEAARP